MPSLNTYCCQKDVQSDGTEYYTVSCHFYRISKEERDEAIKEMKRLKTLFDASNRIEAQKKGKECV